MSKTRITRGQRSLWIFLTATLVGPLLAAAIVAAVVLVAGVIGVGPPSLRNVALAQLGPVAAARALDTYIWSAFPAAGAGAACAAWMSYAGSLPWLAAATLAAVSTTLMAVLSAGVARDHISAVAFIAASVGVGCWLILKRARIIASD